RAREALAPRRESRAPPRARSAEPVGRSRARCSGRPTPPGFRAPSSSSPAGAANGAAGAARPAMAPEGVVRADVLRDALELRHERRGLAPEVLDGSSLEVPEGDAAARVARVGGEARRRV